MQIGAVAQLGERLHGMQEATSSTLVGSTKIANNFGGILLCALRLRRMARSRIHTLNRWPCYAAILSCSRFAGLSVNISHKVFL